jgi:hypothetical protein
VYATALALGVALGAVLTAVTVAPLSGLIAGTSDPAVRAVLPWRELGVMLGALALICVVATTAAAWVAARPSLGAILRLNED